jgi:hypothetical protein
MTAVMIAIPVLVLACDGDPQCPNQVEAPTYEPRVLRRVARKAGWQTVSKSRRTTQDLCRKHKPRTGHGRRTA